MLKDKLKIFREHLGKTQEEMSNAIGVSRRGWQTYEEGKSVPGGNVFQALSSLGCNISWLYDDSLPICKSDQGTHTPPRSAAQGQDITDAVNVQELLNMTAEVLVSDTVYRPALAANIKAFHRSIALEHDNHEFRKRIEKMETRQEMEKISFEQRMTAMEKRLAEALAAPKQVANG